MTDNTPMQELAASGASLSEIAQTLARAKGNIEGSDVTFAQQISGEPATVPEGNAPRSGEQTVPAVGLTDSPTSRGAPPDVSGTDSRGGLGQQRELKTASELAKMIESDLACHPDCPEAGFQVTVYGWPHWRAMLTITPAAGAVRNPHEWRDLTNDLADHLRKHYDLAWE